MSENIPYIKDAIDDLLETSIFKEVSKRNTEDFAQKLAVWLVRYIMLISSRNEVTKIELEDILFECHGEKYQKILEITEKTFRSMSRNEESHIGYI